MEVRAEVDVDVDVEVEVEVEGKFDNCTQEEQLTEVFSVSD